MLVRYDLAQRTVMNMRFDLYEMNGSYDGDVKAGEMDKRMIQAVMATRPGLDEKKIAAMIQALWECEG